MRREAIVAAVTVLLCLSGIPTSRAAQKSCVVDITEVLQKSALTKKAQAQLAAEFVPRRQEVLDAKASGTRSPDEIQALEEATRRDFEFRRTEEFAKLERAVLEAAQKVAAQQGCTWATDVDGSPFYGAKPKSQGKSQDITEEVLNYTSRVAAETG